MRKTMRWIACVLCCLTAVWMTACETSDDPDTDNVDTYFEDNPSEPSSHGSLPATTYSLSVSASPSSLGSDGDKSSLSVSGGTAPYSWTVQDINLGAISADSGTMVIYTRLNAGNNAVQVIDSQGHVGNVIITQP